MHRRVVMPVGPTNSGKTPNALRALAAAKIGVYAGPLRLLAHEIWERLNLGQIVTTGVENAEVTAPPAEPDPDTALDVDEAMRVVRKVGNPKYARLCNVITGEEHKIVDPNSATRNLRGGNGVIYDVAVVDEIQMIGSLERGNGWTSAVLGLRANELHLCGEESAASLVQDLLKDTGDEVIIGRCERLVLLLGGGSFGGDLPKRRIEDETTMGGVRLSIGAFHQ